jgi:hypothetical protein
MTSRNNLWAPELQRPSHKRRSQRCDFEHASTLSRAVAAEPWVEATWVEAASNIAAWVVR